MKIAVVIQTFRLEWSLLTPFVALMALPLLTTHFISRKPVISLARDLLPTNQKGTTPNRNPTEIIV